MQNILYVTHAKQSLNLKGAMTYWEALLYLISYFAGLKQEGSFLFLFTFIQYVCIGICVGKKGFKKNFSTHAVACSMYQFYYHTEKNELVWSCGGTYL